MDCETDAVSEAVYEAFGFCMVSAVFEVFQDGVVDIASFDSGAYHGFSEALSFGDGLVEFCEFAGGLALFPVKRDIVAHVNQMELL